MANRCECAGTAERRAAAVAWAARSGFVAAVAGWRNVVAARGDALSTVARDMAALAAARWPMLAHPASETTNAVIRILTIKPASCRSQKHDTLAWFAQREVSFPNSINLSQHTATLLRTVRVPAALAHCGPLLCRCVERAQVLVSLAFVVVLFSDPPPACVSGGRMKSLDKNSGFEIPKATVHGWDLQSRRMVCGEPGQIGSTKHVRDVTCSVCREILGAPSRAPLRLVPG